MSYIRFSKVTPIDFAQIFVVVQDFAKNICKWYAKNWRLQRYGRTTIHSYLEVIIIVIGSNIYGEKF